MQANVTILMERAQRVVHLGTLEVFVKKVSFFFNCSMFFILLVILVLFGHMLKSSRFSNFFKFKNIFIGCSSGSFGINCIHKCNTYCAGSESCDSITGICDEGCKQGWKGPFCDKGKNNGNSYLFV